MPSAALLQARLDAAYAKLEALRPDSPLSDFENFASLFSDDCAVYLRSMREVKEPALNRLAIVSQLQDIMKDLYFEKRKVVSQVVSEADARAFVEMENKYHVYETVFDAFPETLVATFDDEGLISSFKLYSCRSHIVKVIQENTGLGPYSDEYMA